MSKDQFAKVAEEWPKGRQVTGAGEWADRGAGEVVGPALSAELMLIKWDRNGEVEWVDPKHLGTRVVGISVAEEKARVEEEARRGSSFRPMDLRDIVNGLVEGTVTRHKPEVCRRSDGEALFYRGKVNGLAGDSNSGKTWTALYACAQEMEAGEHAVYLDWEDDHIGIVGRLLDLGADPEAIVERFHYARPDESFGLEAQAELMATLARTSPSLVVIDSTGEAMALDGLGMGDDEAAMWFRKMPSRIAKTGAAVVVLDHMTKASEGKGLWPTGSQRKRAAINGAQYVQENVNTFGKDKKGWSKIKCAKDRHGNYAQKEVVAGLWFEPGMGFELRSVTANEDPGQKMDNGDWRPTALMERASKVIEQAEKPPLSTNDVLAGMGVNRNKGGRAIQLLAEEGYVKRIDGPRNSHLHTSLRPYRQADDPRSDVYETAP